MPPVAAGTSRGEHRERVEIDVRRLAGDVVAGVAHQHVLLRERQRARVPVDDAGEEARAHRPARRCVGDEGELEPAGDERLRGAAVRITEAVDRVGGREPEPRPAAAARAGGAVRELLHRVVVGVGREIPGDLDHVRGEAVLARNRGLAAVDAAGIEVAAGVPRHRATDDDADARHPHEVLVVRRRRHSEDRADVGGGVARRHHRGALDVGAEAIHGRADLRLGGDDAGLLVEGVGHLLGERDDREPDDETGEERDHQLGQRESAEAAAQRAHGHWP